MKIKTLILFLFLALRAIADWSPLNTGINDHLTGVSFFGNIGAVSGHHGIYYTITGGSSPSDWTRFNITSNSVDSAIYNRTKFLHSTSNHEVANFNIIFACGLDTIANKSVIIKLNLNTLAYEIVHYGNTNSQLNYIQKRSGTNDYYAVGNDGLIIHFNSSNTSIVTQIISGTSANLNCISGNSTNIWIGYNGGLLNGTGNGSTVTFNSHSFAGKNFEELTVESGNQFRAAGDGYYSKTGVNTVSVLEYINYDFGPLNGRTIFEKDAYYYVGTDHGIFRSPVGGNNDLEFQPITAGLTINEFWTVPGSPTSFYACGNQGTLLYCSDLGGPTKPFIKLNAFGTCVSSFVNMNVESASLQYCSWYINNQYASSSCGSYSQFFNQTGDYTVSFIGNNGFYSDTSTTTIHIVNVPQVDLPTLITDSILCKSEPVEITLSNVESDVSYSLRKFGSATNFGTSGSTDSSQLTFLTNPINSEGFYYLIASSTVANCIRFFSDTIHLEVEHTEARLHADLHNAYINEPITFHSNSVDASHFNWTFSLGAAILVDTTESVINNFSQLGSTTTKLIATSNYGCADTITQSTTFIYTPTNTINDTWYNRSTTISAPTNGGGHYNPVNKIIALTDGYLAYGYMEKSTIPSQNGLVANVEHEGYYLSKYDDLGTLKWIISLLDVSPFNGIHFDIGNITIDSDQNIYLSGDVSWGTPFIIDNRGDSISLYEIDPNHYQYQYFLAKLDANGKYLWHKLSNDLVFKELATDNENNLIVSTYSYNQDETIVWSNGILDSLPFDPVSTERILKFDENGNFLFHFKIDVLPTPSSSTYFIKCDTNNNIYLGGGFNTDIAFYSSDETLGTLIDVTPSNNVKNYIVKYDENGMFQWIVQSKESNGSIYMNDLVVTEDGTTYVTGNNQCAQNAGQDSHSFIGPNNNMATNWGDFYIAKISSNGDCKWIRALNSSIVGFGTSIAVYNDEVSVLGTIGNYSNNFTEAIYLSDLSGTNLLITMYRYDYFIAVYDTTGNVIRFIKNGCNSNSIKSFYGDVSLLRNNLGKYYIANNWQSFGPNYSNFDFIFPADQFTEATVTKIDTNGGIVITPGYYESKTINICDYSSLTFEDGVTFYYPNIPSYYDAVIPTASGIDSVIATTVNFITPQTINQSTYVCRGSDFTFEDNYSIQDISANQSHSYSIDMGYGCINQYTTNLIVINYPVSASINTGTIISNATEGLYQWVDCNDNFNPVFGETNNSFVPDNNGTYAIVVNEIGCLDTSNCVVYDELTINESNQNYYSISPNPSFDGQFIIQTIHNSEVAVSVTDNFGKLVFSERLSGANKIDLKLPQGIYYVAVYIDDVYNGKTKVVVL